MLPGHRVRHAPRLPGRHLHPARRVGAGAARPAAVLLPPEAAVALAGAAAAEDELDVVHLLLVRVEDAVVALGGRPGLLVLVEEREEVHVDVGVGAARGAGVAGEHAAGQVAVVRRGVGRRSARLVGVALGRPPRLGDHDAHAVVALPEPADRGEHGVQLRVEEAVVLEAVPGVEHAGVGAEQGVVEGDVSRIAGVSEERVRVHHEVRPGLRQEVEHGLHDGLREVLPERARRGRVGRRERRERDGRRHLDGPVEAQPGQRGVHVGHGRDQLRRHVLGRREHLVAHGDALDLRGRVVRRHVPAHPQQRVGRARRRRRDLLVGQRHHHLDAGVREGAQHGGVGVVQLHLRDALLLEQLHNRRWVGQVVRHAAVVHAHRPRLCNQSKPHISHQTSTCVAALSLP
uniref:Uncharacterized protein n=1 Tax=Zea mays TaxID=4577 RepID=A0A804U9B6_MAIZE